MIRLGVLLGAVVSAGVVLVACAGPRPEPTPAAETTGVAPVSGASIYDLDLSLVDAKGQPLRLADLGGRPLVAAMVYASCTSVCPRVTEEMKAIERQLPEADRERVTFALFSLDPGRDTPAALSRFAAEHGLAESRWRLFAASEDGVRDLAAVLGVKYRGEANGEIAHSAMIFAIDGHGVVRHRQMGLGENPKVLVDTIAGLPSA
jgi:protein SCO1